MSYKMKHEHQKIRANLKLADGVYHMRFMDMDKLARLSDDQALAFCGHFLSSQLGMNIRGLAVPPGFRLTARDQRHFNFNFHNTEDSIANQELRAKLRPNVEPFEAGHYPELFRYGVGKLDFFYVVGEVNRNNGVVIFSYIGHVDRPSTFFRRIKVSGRLADRLQGMEAIGNHRQSTHYLDPEFTEQYITRLF